MKFLKDICLPSCVFIIAIVLMVVFKSTPSGKLWDGYSLIYVEKSTDESIINNLFLSSGCKNVISQNNQYVPLNLSAETPELSMALLDLDKSNYLVKRNLYFFDKSGRYKIYYIPDEYKNNINSFLIDAKNNGIDCGLDASASYPIIIPIIVLIFAIFLIIKSKNKILISSLFLPPLLFSFCFPFYTVAVSCCLMFIYLFIASFVLNRQGYEKKLLKNIILLLFFVSSFVLFVFSGIKVFLLYLLMLASQVCVFILYNKIYESYKKRFSFCPVKIRTAYFISIDLKKYSFNLLICSISICLIFIFAVFFGNVGTISSDKNLLLPSANGSGSLPNLNDYVKWKWKVLSSPYVSLYSSNKDSVKEGDFITFPGFKEENDKIVEVTYRLDYNKEFIDDSINFVDKLSYPAIEKMMKNQKKGFSAGYSSSKAQSVSFISLLMIFICLSLSIFTYIYSLLKKNKTM